MYSYNTNIMDPYTELRPKSKNNKIRYDPILTTLFTVYTLFFIFVVIYCGVMIYPFFQGLSQLVQIIIPNEIIFYHSVFSLHNQTIYVIEENLITIINNHTLHNINNTLFQLNTITHQINMTQIQSELNTIVSILQQLIKF